MRKYRKMVFNDCIMTVFTSAVFNIIDAVAGSFLIIYSSKVIANFADSIFEQNKAYGIQNFKTLIICLFFSIFIMPLFGTLKEILLFDNSLKHDRLLYRRYLKKSFLEASQFQEGEIQTRLEQDAIDMRCLWLDLITKFVTTPIILGFLLYSSIRISLIYTFIIIIVSFIKLVVPLSTKKINSKYDKETREYKTNVQSYEFELMNQPHKIMMLGLTDPFIQRFHKIYLNFFKSTLKKKIRLLSLSLNTSNILDSFCTIIIILSGTILIAKDKISVGSIAIALGFLPVFKTLFQNISSIIRDCPVFFTLVDRLTMFYSNEEQTDGVVISNINNINVCNLSFSYNNEIVFQGLNFTIHQGDKIAICGKNGSGKTTLIKVLSGLLNKYSGKILIDGCELSEVKKNSLYNIIAYIEQDPYLFPIPFRDNIQIGNLHASENEFNEVVKKLQIGYLVNRVNCASDQLSGGEKQKISIARALLKKAPIIIMDEPTNNLDKDSKKWLIEFIKQSCETIIFVSHDSDLLSLANITITL